MMVELLGESLGPLREFGRFGILGLGLCDADLVHYFGFGVLIEVVIGWWRRVSPRQERQAQTP
jgi:hypothetical protein